MKYNVPPAGRLVHVEKNVYRDANGVVWIKRSFLRSVLHNPFKYYVFETYDARKKDSSEVKIEKKAFKTGRLEFLPSSFNYYSSFRFPVQHFFADVVPFFLFFNPLST